MDIAQSRRKENIAEYILYLWQLEDMLRALQFSPEAIYSQFVAPRELTEEQKNEILCYVAQKLLSPMATDERPAKEVWEELIGEPFNQLCKIHTEPPYYNT